MRGPSLEKIIRREDGSRVKITVGFGELYGTRFSEHGYSFSVHTCGKGKRSWFGVIDSDSYIHRRLSMEEREDSRIAESMKVITDDELYLAKHELWTVMKPVPL